MSEDTRLERIVPSLLDLGLTRTEAEVYLTCLQLSVDGPVSSYRAAQEMGRDPANIGKVLTTLTHRQAVRVVQKKPRLYLPVALEDFSEQVLQRIRDRRDDAVRLLETFETPATDGLATPLAGLDSVLAKARDLLATCRAHAVVCGSGDLLRELGHDLERAGEMDGCDVSVLSPRPFWSNTVRIVSIPEDANLSLDDGNPWLHLVVDRQAWLTAADGGGYLSGWWSQRSSTATVLASTLELACLAAGLSERLADVAPLPQEAPGPEPAFEAGIVVPEDGESAPSEPEPEPEREIETEPEPEPDSRHETATDIEVAGLEPPLPSPDGTSPDAHFESSPETDDFGEEITFLFRRPDHAPDEPDEGQDKGHRKGGA